MLKTWITYVMNIHKWGSYTCSSFYLSHTCVVPILYMQQLIFGFLCFQIHRGKKSYPSFVLSKYKDSVVNKVLSCIENEGAYKIDGIKSLSILCDEIITPET